MFFIWGSYGREATFREVAMCSRCSQPQPVEFRRVWRTGHFFFFPLFSYADRMLSRCQACGSEGAAHYPRPLPSLPMLDRLGWLFPVSAIALVFVLLVGLMALAPSAPRGPSAAAGASIRMDLDRHLSLRDVHETPDEAAIAAAVGGALTRAYRDIGSVHVGVRVMATGEASAHRRAIVLVHVSNLRRVEDGVRARVLDDVRDALAETLSPDDEAIVGIKGSLLYGAMAQGRVGAPWVNPRVAAALNDELDAALGEFARSP